MIPSPNKTEMDVVPGKVAEITPTNNKHSIVEKILLSNVIMGKEFD